ncbi:phosphopantetheine-binding protein [Frankia torreyi]|uniref:phosphopantetheine-binding protein n=1 Tax=Frankia torreyi TaxID=1856 RepID=UPI003BB4E694
MGLDSLDTVSLIAALEEEFACAVPPEVDMGRIRTLQDVVDAIVLATRPKETASLGEKPRDVDVAARD